nr:hypothetical protein CFP56_69047 [Quercus suber]
MISQKWNQSPVSNKLDLFFQTLLGLQALHAIRWVNRDLRSNDLCVVSLHGAAPRAVIIDFGQATKHTSGMYSPRARHCGTIGFSALELESPHFADPACNSMANERESYDQRVDIWSIVAVAIVLFNVGVLPWNSRKNIRRVEQVATEDATLHKFVDLHDQLGRSSEASLGHLSHRTLVHQAEDRPNVETVSSHSSVQDTAAAMRARQREEQSKPGKKRRAS